MDKKDLLEVIGFVERRLIELRMFFINGTENEMKEDFNILWNQIRFLVTDPDDIL